MKSKLRQYSDQELINELERRRKDNLNMLISSDIKETIRIPKQIKKVRIVDKEVMGDYKVMIYSPTHLPPCFKEYYEK